MVIFLPIRFGVYSCIHAGACLLLVCLSGLEMIVANLGDSR